jgi:hypothetical protein
MAIKVTENWSGQQLSFVWPWTASREFVVTGTADLAAALVAVDPTTGVAIPQENAGHPFNTTRLLCKGPQLKEAKGPEYFVITCSYAVSETGEQNGGDKDSDPLKDPPKIRWEHVEETVPTDRDLDNRPIVDSAGTVIEGQTLPIRYKRLYITKNFPYYDLNFWKTYEGATNESDVLLGGVLNIAAQHMRFNSAIPATEYTPDAEFIPMQFSIDIVPRSLLGNYPFQLKVLDAGAEGWASVGGTKTSYKFTDTDKQPSGPVRLDGSGKPLTKPHPTIKVGDSRRDPVSPTSPPSFYKKEAYNEAGTVTAVADGTDALGAAASTVAVFLYFKGARVIDFSPLSLLI